MNLFSRSISVNARLKDKRTVTLDGVFLDSNHEICLSIDVDLERNLIISAEGEFRRVPFTDCAYTKECIDKLIGLNLNGNIRKQIKMAAGLKEGCTHLADLALECVKGLMPARLQLMHLIMGEEEINKIVENYEKEYLEGSCRHY